MNQDSGWRKRQIALDIKAENARELELDYEPEKSKGTSMTQDEVMKLAKQAGFERLGHTDDDWVCLPKNVENFAEIIALAERKTWEVEFAGMGEWACVYLLQERNK